jgi:cytochrome c peroxidase
LLILAAGSLVFAADFDFRLPPGFPKPFVPADNPMSAAKAELGRYLFYDRRLSANGESSCATCHRQELAFTDGRGRARGTTGEMHPRGSMSLVNVAYAPALTWANPALDSLEEQALGPMLNTAPIELGLKGHEQELMAKLKADSRYSAMFPKAFPGEAEPFALSNITKALATFERTIISMRSPYDSYRWGADMTAISDSAKRGEVIFSSGERAGCFQCHGGWNFSSIRYEGSRNVREAMPGAFFNTGVSQYAAPNRGIYEFTGRAEDVGKFRAPTLRNIALTAPYMHDGSLATLGEVIDHYAAGGKYAHANKSRELKPFRLTADEKRDLIEFLRSLTDEEMRHDPRWSDPWPAGYFVPASANAVRR